jgi:hypothetical protein
VTAPFRIFGPATPGRSRLLARARRLASTESYHLLRALFLLLEIDLRLRWTGFARLQGALCRPTPRRTVGPLHELPSERELIRAQHMARALRRVARFVPRTRCLHRALALLLWLRRQGVVADLRMGVRSSGEAIEGHAWVEWRGVVLDEEPALCDSFPLLEPPRCQ